YIRRRKKFYVHDENNESRVGDLVRIEETRPLSKLKRWRLVEIIRKAERREGE
ncbi:MAG: 30S ribosomal protein S17, partial [candidate division WOR-3 bacterium]